MPDYDPPAAYQYASRWHGEVASFHPECLVAEMVDRQELSPAARDMEPEWVLNQHAGASGIVREDAEIPAADADPWEFPLSLWPNNALAEQQCGRCEQPILPPAAPFTATQSIARDLAAADLGEDRNDYDLEWCDYADQKFGAKAQEFEVAYNALRQYREHEQITDWALSGAQATEALNRPHVPDDIERLKERFASPIREQHGPRPTP